MDSGSPMWLLKLPVCSPNDPHVCFEQVATMSLVLVLPALPVMPTMVPSPVLAGFRRESLKCTQGIVDANDPSIAAEIRVEILRTRAAAAPRLSTSWNELVAVVMFAIDSDEQVARPERTRVDAVA